MVWKEGGYVYQMVCEEGGGIKCVCARGEGGLNVWELNLSDESLVGCG